jgi:hypothetical protein
MLNPRKILAVAPRYDVSSGSEADMKGVSRDVRFTPPKSGHVRCNYGCPLWANSGHCPETRDDNDAGERPFAKLVKQCRPL